MNETTKIVAKANETMARSKQEQLNLTQKVAAGEMSKEKALEILDELEKADTDLIADIDRRIERLDKPFGGIGGGDRTIWLVLIPLAIFGSFAAWVIISSLREG